MIVSQPTQHKVHIGYHVMSTAGYSHLQRALDVDIGINAVAEPTLQRTEDAQAAAELQGRMQSLVGWPNVRLAQADRVLQSCTRRNIRTLVLSMLCKGRSSD